MKHELVAPRDAAARLDRTLSGAAQRAGLTVTIAQHRCRPWASATFTGTQHELTLVSPRAPQLGRWVATLPEADLALRGHFVASLAVDRIEDDGREVRLDLTVLTIEEA